MNKILSIIIPTYNMEKYLHRCLKSLIINDKDLFRRPEILIVNDGSKDSSSQIAHGYEDKYPEVFKVIDKENGNYGSCVNYGLKEATGKYIKILDADDYFDTSNLYQYLLYLSKNESDIFITDFNVVNLEGKKIREWRFKFPQKKELNVNDYCITPSYKNLEMHAITYRTSLLVDNKYKQTEGISYTDQEWMFIPMTYAKTFHYLSIPVYHYVLGREGQTMDPQIKRKSIDQLEVILFRKLNVISQSKIGEEIFQYLLSSFLSSANYIYSTLLLINNIDKLKNIDYKIRVVNPQIYILMNDIVYDRKFWPFKYVKYWRNNYFLITHILLKGYVVMMWIKGLVR